MSRIAIGASVVTSGIKVSRPSDPYTVISSTTSDEAAVTADITAAEANGTISGNGTALGLVQQIGTDFTALTTALAVAGSGADVVVSYNPATVLTRNQLQACLAAVLRAASSAADLS